DLIDKLQLDPNSYFELIELGAGDGSKTKELLRMIDAKNFKFDYFPIDISINSLKLLKQDLNEELPNVSVQTKQGDYFGVLASLKESKLPKIVLFLGSNIGNMSDEMAAQFIYNLSATLQAGDKLVLGVDLIKPKELVLPAYDDHQGITAKFNLNLLKRINDELGGNFDLNNFEHQAEYNEEEGIAKSFITSTIQQKVTIKAMEKSFEFAAAEKIHTEVSRKYNDAILTKIIANTDFRICNKIMDSKDYFADYILERS
ncbi:MAG: L-histidine N-alpha-methyltransferase, partial [Flavobacterium sp.]